MLKINDRWKCFNDWWMNVMFLKKYSYNFYDNKLCNECL